MRGRKWIVFAAAWVAVLCAAVPAAAQGGLDRSFGVDGVLHLDPEAPYEGMQVDPEGRIYFLGQAYRCGAACPADRSLSRLLPDGSQDFDFGEGGTVSLPAGSRREPATFVLAVDPKGRPLVSMPARKGVSIARLKPDGSVDTSFGRAGVRTLFCACREPYASVEFDRRGRILVVITYHVHVRTPPHHTLEKALVLRLLPNGSRDRSFNVVKMSSRHRGSPYPALVQRNGSLVLSGSDGSPSGFYLMRVEADGTLDRRFNRAVRGALARLRLTGRSFLSYAWPSVLISRPGGVIHVVGTRPRGGFVLRLLPDGRLDSRFAQKGIKRFGWRVNDAIAAGAGKVFAVGENKDKADAAFLLDTAGDFDASFNGGRPLRLRQLDQMGGLVLQRGKPLLFDNGAKGCRYYCPPEPKLFRFTVGH